MFSSMSFGEAVSYVQTMGMLITGLIVSIPIGAVIAIRRGRRHRPGAPLWLARGVLAGWVLLLVAGIGYFFTGAWYSENGPPPQVVAVQVTRQFVAVLMLALVVHLALYRTTGPRRTREQAT